MDKIAKEIEAFIRTIVGLDDPSKSLLETFLPQLIATTILFLIIRFTLWKSITNMLETRKKYIATQISEAELLNKQAISTEANIASKLTNLENNAKSIIDDAKHQATIQANFIIEKAHLEAQVKIEKAQNEILKEEKRAIDSLRNEVSSLALLAAEKIIEREIDATKHSDILEKSFRGLE